MVPFLATAALDAGVTDDGLPHEARAACTRPWGVQWVGGGGARPDRKARRGRPLPEATGHSISTANAARITEKESK
jgi:hypothetical protein